MHRVVVTGWGVVSPIGNTASAYWDALSRGVSGIGPASGDPAVVGTNVVAEVKGFDPGSHFDARQLALMDRFAQLGVVAAREAVAQAGLPLDGPVENCATIIGCASGGWLTVDDSFRRLYREGARRLSPFTVARTMVNAASSHIAMEFGLTGPTFTVTSACASATHAMGLAFHMVRAGSVACAVTGGTEATISFGALKAWEAMRILSPDTCRPFSRDRNGIVVGEGAAVLVLETRENAKRRGAEILGEIVGFGMSAGAKGIINGDVDGMARAIKAALADGNLSPEEIQYVNAHGTGTPVSDESETAALKAAFGAHARNLAISSTKSMVGHSFGGSGALGLVATLMAIRAGVAPPTIGYLGADPACDLDYIPNAARDMSIDNAVSNSFAFGGVNAVLAVRRYL